MMVNHITTGNEARDYFFKSKLKVQDLAKIWYVLFENHCLSIVYPILGLSPKETKIPC